MTDRKKSIRAGHRASVTRALGNLTTALESTPPNPDHLARLKLTLNEKLEILNKLDSEIIELIDEAAVEEDIQQADEYKDRIYDALTSINKVLNPAPMTPAAITAPTTTAAATAPTTTAAVITPTTTTAPTIPAAITTPTTAAAVTPPTPAATMTTTPAHIDPGAKVKLPKITLPHFNGNLIKWPSFWDSFESAIHNNTALSEIDKFNYLRSLLERSAYDAIAGLTLSAMNYQQAIEILQKRFGNKQVIISKHMETLLNLEPVTSDHHLRDLRRLYDTMESHIRSLKSLGVEANTYGTMLSSVFLNKLPPDLRLIVSRKLPSTDEIQIEHLLELFEEELVARERSATLSVPQGHGQCSNQRKGTRHSTFFTGAQESESMSCCYCQQQHSSKDCATVPDINARKQILRKAGRCYNCLRKGHMGRQCRSSTKCQLCKGKHHTSICESKTQSNTQDKNLSLAQPGDSTNPGLNPGAPAYVPTTTTNTLCSDRTNSVLLQTARCVLQNPRNPKKLVEVRLLLDSGSQKSYLSERAKNLLALESSTDQLLSIATFGSQGAAKVCPVVNVKMCLKGYPPMSLSLYVVPTICEPLVSQPITACVQKCQAFSGLDLADHADGEANLPVDMLVGSDHYWDLVTGSVCKIEGGPTAVHTKLGWVLSGPTSTKHLVSCSMNLNTTHVLRVDAQPSECSRLEEQLRSFWDLETLGILGEEKTLYDDFTASIAFHEGRYHVSLPWKEFHDPLPDNYSLSVRRLKGLLCRLKRDPVILQEYDRTIKDQLEKGIVEVVPEDESQSTRTHYLPHHAVVRQDRTTTKLRVVYDASAKSGGPSLNECLQKGPKFNQLILDLLLRFRSYRVALTADVEKAFLMIGVDVKDRDALRFIWVDDVTKEDPKLIAYRFTRVVFGVSSSPFLLNATIKFHLETFMESHRATVDRLLHSTYVDDVVSGADSEAKGFELYSQSKELFRRGGFNLRKFLTSSKPLQQKINQAEGESIQPTAADPSVETYAHASLGMQSHMEPNECKVLGVLWNQSNDTLVFDFSELAQVAADLQPTKRNLVSLVGRFYDPLGFLAPITVKFKILFQRLCQNKSDWDSPLPSKFLVQWKELIADLKEGGPIAVPRSYLHSVVEPVSPILCGFCDASSQAYAAVVYLALQTNLGITVRFVVSKTRVVPLQSQTIPRLELLSALLLSKLIVSVTNGLKLTLPPIEVRCYTDSLIALYWIRGSNKEWKPFVENRVGEIRRNVHPSQWSHCPGRSNPADLPSRGLSALEVSVSQLWRQGPEWLSVGFEPSVESELTAMPEECSRELRSRAARALTLVNSTSVCSVSELIDCKRFSTLSKLLRVTAQVLLAVQKFKALKARSSTTSSTITPMHVIEAELLWVKDVQRSMQQESSFEQHRRQFSLFMDEKGVWRCKGRLSNVDVEYSVKNPIFLLKGHPLTSLIVRDAHDRVFHNGIRDTLTEIRRKFWIPRVRSLAKQLIYNCVLCRKLEGRSYKPPPPPPLPTCRVKEDPAFTYCGVDFAGPFFVRCCTDVTQKVWICLFTCYVTRAVHLDATPDQSTESFIRCLKRFSARRGLPAKFISDNGKTFKAADKYLKSVFKDGEVKKYLTELKTDWMFNVERAPWWGGAFERLVRSTKRCLRKLIGRAQFSLDELVTVLAEIEAVINSRPLSYVSPDDLEEPLTPSHLIVGRRILNLPDHLSHIDSLDDKEFTPTSSQLTRRMKHIANVLNHFWKRWRGEYLHELREAHAYTARNQKVAKHSEIEVGDIVIVHDEHLPRSLWKLGKIETLMKGQDGNVRAATVRMGNSDGRQILLNRPIQLLYPLEVRSPTSEEGLADEAIEENVAISDISEDDEVQDLLDSPDSPVRTTATNARPRRSQRAAARMADATRKACSFALQDD